MLAAIAEFERELIRERTGEGRKRAQAAGVKFGRKRKLSDHQRAEAIKRRAAGETLASIAKSYAVDLNWSVLLSIVWLGDIGNWENRTAFAFATPHLRQFHEQLRFPGADR